jgi:DNA mismatch repair protein MutS
MIKSFNSIINKKENLLIENYFDLQKESEKYYGQSTLIFIEIGSFYEIYQYDDIGKAVELSKTLNILLTKKNKKIKEVSIKNPYMCGVPTVSLEKHIEKLMSENKWTIILIEQIGETPNITRKVKEIVSPGINTKYNLKDDYNYIASIYAEKTKTGIIYAGITLIDVSIGKTITYENYGVSDDKELVIDEINQIIKSHKCSEFVITTENMDELVLDYGSVPIHKKQIKKELNISFQEELLKKIYKVESFLTASEDLNIERLPNARSSLVILLTYIMEHNDHLIKKIKRPEILDPKRYLYLGNNPLEELDINTKNGLNKIINKARSAIGRRYIAEQLYNPITDKDILNKRYEKSLELLELDVSTELSSLYDIERLKRKIDTDQLAPFELAQIYKSLQSILSILDKEKFDLDSNKIKENMKKIEDFFILEKLELYNNQNIDENIIKNSNKINQLLDQQKIEENKIIKIVSEFEKPIEGNNLNNISFKNLNLKYTEMDGYYIEITNQKYKKFSFIDAKIKSLKNSKKIILLEMEEISNNLVLIKQKIIALNKKEFQVFIAASDFSYIDEIVLFIGELEFYINNAQLKKLYNYNKPNILTHKDSFIEIEELRHPIIERDESIGLFVPNNIAFGSKKYTTIKLDEIYQDKEKINGLLLYGLNSAGKTVLSKSIGMAVILAQAGFFVPAKQMNFTIFENIFTRISGKDNLHKGLSTFAVELLDLKNIFQRASNKTLVLGDEISHGTETISGLSIVSSAIIHLVKKDCFFLFATHLHQLKDIKEVSGLKTINNIHLEVNYDENKDMLYYNRKIKKGSGSTLYGLEFAKYLKLPKDFLKTAYSIRSQIASDLDEISLLSKQKSSKYNSSLIVSSCAICGEKADDVHHIKEQHMAKDGFIDGVKMNHKHNLLPLCKSHHDKAHDGSLVINGFIRTTNGFELLFEEK